VNLGEFRELTRSLPDSIPMTILNTSYEWYGHAEIQLGSWKVVDGNLVFNFANDPKWPRDDEKTLKAEFATLLQAIGSN